MALYGIVAFVLTGVLTYGVRWLATAFGVVDVPDLERKKHRQPVALWGGIAIFVSFWATVAYVQFHPILGVEILSTKLAAAFMGSSVLLVVGLLDDKYDLPSVLRFILTIVAVLITVFGGLHVAAITNPAGGLLDLTRGQIVTPLGNFFLLADALVFVWLLGTMYTTKLLDGLDGLATGVAAIGGGSIFLLTTFTRFYQPNVALIALIFTCACLGFLVFNFSPASIFLGEAGSLFIGFMLGVLAIIAGSKVATAFLVLAIPILDVARVIYIRIKHHQSVFIGDRNHLHFALVDMGLSERQVVLIFYAFAALFGAAALFLQSMGKLIVLAAIFVVMVFVAVRVQFTQPKV